MNLKSLLFELCSIVGWADIVVAMHHTALIAQQCCIAFALRINHIVNTIITHFCSKIEAIVKSNTDGQFLFGTLLRASGSP